MKSKIFLIFSLIFLNHMSYASWHEDGSSNDEDEVATQIYDHESLPAVAEATHHADIESGEEDIDDLEYSEESISELPAVAIYTSLSYKLYQLFTHSNKVYKNIAFDSFFEHYSDAVETLVIQAQVDSMLSSQKQANVVITQMFGEMPLEHDEPLFDCEKARTTLVSLVENFIDNNEEAVRAKCIGHLLKERRSNVVWAPYCCGIQLHKHCFKECEKSGLDTCPNSFCTKPNWTRSLYRQVSKDRKMVASSGIFDVDCPICMDPLKVKGRKVGVKQIADDKSVGSANSVIQSKGKKKRFL